MADNTNRGGASVNFQNGSDDAKAFYDVAKGAAYSMDIVGDAIAENKPINAGSEISNAFSGPNGFLIENV